MDVEWPDWRADVLNGLDVLASEPPRLDPKATDPRWPDLRNAVHWVVDDTWWDHRNPQDSVGTLLRNSDEAAAVARVVDAIVRISDRHGPSASDTDWFSDPEWPEVRASASKAAATLRA